MSGADFVDLADKAVDGPEGRVVGAVGFAASELVVEDDGAVGGQRFEGFEVVVSGSGTAVEDEQGGGAVVADPAVPDAEPVRQPDGAFLRLYLNLPPGLLPSARSLAAGRCGANRSVRRKGFRPGSVLTAEDLAED